MQIVSFVGTTTIIKLRLIKLTLSHFFEFKVI